MLALTGLGLPRFGLSRLGLLALLRELLLAGLLSLLRALLLLRVLLGVLTFDLRLVSLLCLL